uniref:Homing endonuclease n=1 Tax=Caulobacter phage BL57 TaxID=3348355 RepID=A0AB74UH07_9VIRU
MSKLTAHVKRCLLTYPSLYAHREEVLVHMFFVLGNGYRWEKGVLVCDSSKYRDSMDYSDAEASWRSDEEKAAIRADYDERVANIDKLASTIKDPYFRGFDVHGYYSHPENIVRLTHAGYLFDFPDDIDREYREAAADLLERVIECYKADYMHTYLLAYIRHKVMTGRTRDLKGSMRLDPDYVKKLKDSYAYSMFADKVFKAYGGKEDRLSSNGSGSQRVSAALKITEEEIEAVSKRLVRYGFKRTDKWSWKAFNNRVFLVEKDGKLHAVSTVIHVHPTSYRYYRHPLETTWGNHYRGHWKRSDTSFIRAGVRRMHEAFIDPLPELKFAFSLF